MFELQKVHLRRAVTGSIFSQNLIQVEPRTLANGWFKISNGHLHNSSPMRSTFAVPEARNCENSLPNKSHLADGA